jgi:hypothetical protein
MSRKCAADNNANDNNAAAGGTISVGGGATPSLLSDSPPSVMSSAGGAGMLSAITMTMDGNRGSDAVVGGTLDAATNGERDDWWRIQ